jgi:hypothetical protein
MSGPLLAQFLVLFAGYGPTAVWSLPVVWAVWAAGVVLGVLGAFVRPGGLHVGAWAAVVVDYVLVPRKAVWTPGTPSGGRSTWTGSSAS